MDCPNCDQIVERTDYADDELLECANCFRKCCRMCRVKSPDGPMCSLECKVAYYKHWYDEALIEAVLTGSAKDLKWFLECRPSWLAAQRELEAIIRV